MSQKYKRLKVATERGPRWYWAKDFSLRPDGSFSFLRCREDGDIWHGRGSDLRVVLGAKGDLLEEQPARMNLTYGILEVGEEQNVSEA